MAAVHYANVLDHGYVAIVESWGSDAGIIEAARMSTNKGFQGWGKRLTAKILSTYEEAYPARVEMSSAFYETWLDPQGYNKATVVGNVIEIREEPGDENLLRYLYEHKHSTPFEFAGLIIEVQAPIFIFREWHRHRTQSYNEMSARYTPLPDLNYVPTRHRLLMNANTQNKQAGTDKDAEILMPVGAFQFQEELMAMYTAHEAFYQKWLKRGVPKELARIDLPVARYSRMRATANLRNWLAFLTLRDAEDAMWEIRQYAKVVSDIIKETFPRTYELYAESK